MYSPPASMMSRLASVTFKMASKVLVEETDKNFDFITEILFRFLGFGDFKIPIVTENKTLVLFGNFASWLEISTDCGALCVVCHDVN